MKILFIGYNPGITSASTRHHYAHKSNRFWRLLHDAGLTQARLTPEEDKTILDLGFGSTNIVDRPSISTADIKHHEMEEGALLLRRLIETLKPSIACFVGIGVYRAFASVLLKKPKGRLVVVPGLQAGKLFGETLNFVCYNPSGLNTVPYAEQLQLFIELKNLSESLNTGFNS